MRLAGRKKALLDHHAAVQYLEALKICALSVRSFNGTTRTSYLVNYYRKCLASLLFCLDSAVKVDNLERVGFFGRGDSIISFGGDSL